MIFCSDSDILYYDNNLTSMIDTLMAGFLNAS